MSYTVIIPSRNAANLYPCCDSIWKRQPGAKIIVIDDGLESIPNGVYSVIPGIQPFSFPRNVNLGIVACSPDDVILHNDDALLESDNGFDILAQALIDNPDYALVAATTNVTGQRLQWRQNVGLRPVPHMAFVSVYIPRRTIEILGMLDERYSIDYGVDDRDYCEAAHRAGLKVGVHDHCYVDHAKLKSAYRGDPTAPRSFAENYRLFKEKWGVRE